MGRRFLRGTEESSSIPICYSRRHLRRNSNKNAAVQVFLGVACTLALGAIFIVVGTAVPCQGFSSLTPISAPRTDAALRRASASLGTAKRSATARHERRVIRPDQDGATGRRGTAFVTMAKMSPMDDGTTPTATTTTSAWLLSLCLPLWLVYITNQWSRFAINSLVDFSSSSKSFAAMNVELNFDQAQYGLLASVAFTSLFAVASVAAGYLTDKVGDRKRITALSALAWSAATFGMSQSTSYAQVVACRVATGLACAFSTPAAYTLLKERVPANQQALASSVYGTGVAVASALSALSIVLDNQYGWRNTLLLIAGVGLAASTVSALLLPEDDQKKTDATAEAKSDSKTNTNSAPFLEEVKDVLTSSPRVQWIFLASLLRFGSGLTIGIWGAPYFRLAYPDAQNLFAAYLATISAVGATISGIAGGAVADKLSQRMDNDDSNDNDLIGRRLWVPIVGSVLAAPAWYLAVQSHQDFQTSMGFLALEYLVAECWFGPTISTLQASVRPGTGGTAQGIFTLTGAVGNLAPSIIGFLYASSQAGDAATSAAVDDLSGLLAVSVGLGYLASAACFAAASKASATLSAVADTKSKRT